MRSYLWILSFLMCTTMILSSGCKTQQNPGTDPPPVCDQQGTVKDFAGLDGCGLLIISETGEKLLPSKLPQGAQLIDGQRIRFAFKAGEDMASACMAEDRIVEITCFEVIGSDQ